MYICIYIDVIYTIYVIYTYMCIYIYIIHVLLCRFYMTFNIVSRVSKLTHDGIIHQKQDQNHGNGRRDFNVVLAGTYSEPITTYFR